MISRITSLFAVLVATTTAASLAHAESVGPWDLAVLNEAPASREAPEAKQAGVQAILYEGLPLNGKKVEVFAYYGVPKGKAPAGGWPAVVCIHGGGGTAFHQWVQVWNRRGYAAISMDLEGHYPIKKPGAEKAHDRKGTPNPGPSRVGVFHDYAKPVERQWYYHAVAQVMLAHSLIRSFPEVNAEKTGVTGISWGGNLTSTTMGVDTRFKFAVPVYGCGFLVGSAGHQGRAISAKAHQDFVRENYDGSAYFDRVDYPTLWVNGTNDFHFAMPATQSSADATDGQILFIHEMPHGHGPGWAPKEIYAFADSVVNGGPALPRLDDAVIVDGKITASWVASAPATDAKLYFTRDAAAWPERKWESQAAVVDGDRVIATLPDGVAAAYLAARAGGLMGTSRYAEVN